MPQRSISPELAHRLKDKNFRVQINQICETAQTVVTHHPRFAHFISGQDLSDFKEVLMYTIYELIDNPAYYDKQGNLLLDAVLDDTTAAFLVLFNDGRVDNFGETLR